MSAAEVLAKHRYAKAGCDGCCKSYGYPDRHAAHQIEALKAAGYAVVERSDLARFIYQQPPFRAIGEARERLEVAIAAAAEVS